jgi:hypothetical protein
MRCSSVRRERSARATACSLQDGTRQHMSWSWSSDSNKELDSSKLMRDC